MTNVAKHFKTSITKKTLRMKEPPASSVVSLKGFSQSHLKQCVLGLTSFLKKKNENDLLDSYGCIVNILINLKVTPPSNSSHPLCIDLPFPLYFRPNIRLCVIVRDPQKKWKEKLHQLWKENETNLMDLPKVIGISKLRKNYPTMASKRTLCRSYDIFLCDTRVVDQMPRLLGRTFITAGKLPIEVPIKESRLLEPIQNRLKQTFMSIRTGSSLSIKIGFSHDPPKHLYKNILAAINSIAGFFIPEPFEENGDATKTDTLRRNQIMSIYLTATNAPAIHIYLEASVMKSLRHIASKAHEDKKSSRTSHSKDKDLENNQEKKRLRRK